MGIFRGTGGTGDSTTDTTVSIVTQKAVEAEASATAAASSATAAANSATNAATSEANAATSETNAATSANTASTAATNAESAYDSFDDRYLGVKISNPSVDNDGDALLTGALYWNSATNKLMIYDGSSWQIGSPKTSAEIKTAYESNADTNAFTDAQQSKLTGIETGATADQTPSEILASIKTVDGSGSGLDADLLDGIEASAFLQNVSEDTTPQLGGTLDANGNDINLDGNDLILNDSASSNAKLFFNAGGDNIIIRNENTGGTNNGINIDSEGPIKLRRTTSFDPMIEATPQGSVDLYHNNSKKLETTSTGVTVTGALQTSSDIIVGGDLTVSGTTTTVDTETINLADNIITLNSNETGTPSQNAGIEVERGTSANKTFQWNETSDYWETDDNFNVTGNITVSGTVDGRDIATDGTKLDGIEANATADQTAAEIRTLVDSATDSNVFTDADHTKLDGIEASADVTDTANVTAAGALMDSEVTNLAQVKAFDSADYATAAQGTTADSALQNIVEDTTPQLGGDLDCNGNGINVDQGDIIDVGGLQIQNLSTYNSAVLDTNGSAGTSGSIYISPKSGSHVYIRNGSNALFSSETMASFLANSAVSLYYDNAVKIATTSTGIDVTGDADISGSVIATGQRELLLEYTSFQSNSVPVIAPSTTDQTLYSAYEIEIELEVSSDTYAYAKWGYYNGSTFTVSSNSTRYNLDIYRNNGSPLASNSSISSGFIAFGYINSSYRIDSGSWATLVARIPLPMGASSSAENIPVHLLTESSYYASGAIETLTKGYHVSAANWNTASAFTHDQVVGFQLYYSSMTWRGRIYGVRR